METDNPPVECLQPRRLRAFVEIIGGKIKVFPVCSTDEEAAEIFDAIKLIRENGA